MAIPSASGQTDAMEDEGGEAACWLSLVCPECGKVRERDGSCACPPAAEDPTTSKPSA
ncbi:hypothetical protein AB0K51_00920 [Kitasatospora sp. NPDC049285]|uniref:hypothetical protein n=1 Tax=Kitasatospora sp. NPDC049285 TaxID=3157096 RepID=UPI0034154AAC